MTTLLLLRHAKSSWDDTGLADIDRPLNDRGLRAAPVMGRYMASRTLFPDRILCSSAKRTRETLGLILGHLRSDSEVTITDRLYWNSEDSYLPVIGELAGPSRTVLVIGHNPGIHDTALEAVGAGDPTIHSALAEKFPTCALAVITVPGPDWPAIVPGSGMLRDFVRPRDLTD